MSVSTEGTYDLAVVGAGIVGLAVARELLTRRPGLRLAVIDKEPAVGAHQTGHNSGVIHAGIYYQPGSLKARLCVEGAAALFDYCEQREIALDRCGKVIVALHERELGRLEELERRGRANGVPGLRRVDAAGLRELEPHAAGVAALHSPNTAIVDFPAVARALADDVRAAGGELLLGTEIVSAERRAGGAGLLLRGADGRETVARRAVFCAGLWADRVARAAGADADPRIVPFRGQYLTLAPAARSLVRGLIYPVPDPALPFLGVHLTKHVSGEVWAGPSALLVGARDAYAIGRVRPDDLRETLAWPGTWKVMARYWRSGLDELRLAASRRAFAAACAEYVPALQASDLLPGQAGVRAQAVSRDGRLVDDFVFSQSPDALHVRNAPSPAATSALAIAGLVADRAQEALGLDR
ncbi:L-2-hydroxyglutarate oxidase [Conexibacter sp. JD483]|uniref:L-2-hydroxyglutarate oxidase n=1 Tax=unclassified Conexibacter TaxID=2627773 RepID=UPI00271F0E62|nr:MULTISPECIES: L-2-hydroxyglutarate oxidase [unclassified Conexibacter]MDO8189130.1 L-2-hydroxyglutarate oxidase [Conexibacter sp. CPCC 205706]MDO8201852.1 L-2-hydroxyglutarate oxidase [Conexibacter sp. CPCC 205762]MDR9371838.1 L-2-hydroxyglutarate oxidase [Conexibacter sp. JD483]